VISCAVPGVGSATAKVPIASLIEARGAITPRQKETSRAGSTPGAFLNQLPSSNDMLPE
jgi:hypothetical protein